MAARRYEISLRVLKNVSLYYISIYYINTNGILGKLYYAAKGANYYVTIATMIFSRVKITCYFHM